MIYTSSYLGESKGDRVSISLSKPKGQVVASEWDVFKPAPAMLSQWKKSAQDDAAWEVYTDAYRSLLQVRRDALMQIVANPPQGDVTLLCWEADPKYCHRTLAGRWIAKFLPELWGGELLPEPVGLPSDATVSINPDADIFRWFLSAEVVVPRGFMLHPHAAVIDPIVFVERLKNDAQSALDFCEGRSLVEDPRQRSGALQKDLKRLQEVNHGN